MLELLSKVIIDLIQSTGYFGVFLLMTVESALIPFPSEITMPFAGFLAQQGVLSFWPVVLAGTIGNLIGSLIAYGLGYFLEETVILTLIARFGKLLLITEHEYMRARHWFNKYGSSIAFFSRLLPAVRTFISLPAGLAEMNLWKFSLYTTLGSFLWSLFLTSVGFYLGENWHSLEPYYQKFELVIGAIVIVFVLWYVNHKLKLVRFDKKT